MVYELNVILKFLFATTVVSRRTSGLITHPPTQQISEDLFQEMEPPERETLHLEQFVEFYL
jgi:hypothetical protein